MNRELMTLYALGDLQALCDYFEVTARAAKQSKSGLRYNEVCNVYMNMVSRWPYKLRVRKLEELLREERKGQHATSAVQFKKTIMLRL